MKPEDFEQASEAQIEECFRNFLERFEQSNSQPVSNNGKFVLSKIMLNLTDRCNLDCRYCYASKYYDEEDMSEEMIDKVISKFFLSAKVDEVRRVVFFGGEPLLNLSGFEYFIDRMEGLFEEGIIPKIPIFNIITNGTIYSERIGRLLKKYNMGVIVSCDGPPELQNGQRPFRHLENDSYEIVAENIKRMRTDGLKIGIEATITKHTLEAGYTFTTLKEYFLKELGVESVTCVPENMTSPEKVFDYSEFQEQDNEYFRVLKNLEYDTEEFEVPYRLLLKRPLSYACGLGQTSFHVLANGDVYPCQVIAGMDEFKICDIDSFSDTLFKINTWIKRYDEQSSKCLSCWAKPICKFCPAREILESGSYTLTDKACDLRRNKFEDLIVNVVKLRKEPQLWNDFTGRLREKAKAIEENIDTIAAII